MDIVNTFAKNAKKKYQKDKMENPIYKLTGKAAEYAHLALNLYDGCDNGCLFCYAPAVLHKSREEFAKCKPREGIIDALEKQLDNAELIRPLGAPLGKGKRVLLCFTCDPYPSIHDTGDPPNDYLAARALVILKDYEIPFQVLTKSGRRALKDANLYGPNDAFASTLTFMNPDDSKKWEPNAALPEDRMATLRKFHEAGIHTCVSLEPVIDPEQTLELIKATHEYVDLYKVGKLNYVKSDINWRMFGARVIKILESLDKKYYIKSDLVKHLDGIPFTNTDNRTV